MNPLKARIACLQAAMKAESSAMETSADRLLRTAFVFECYAAFGLDAGLQTLERTRTAEAAKAQSRVEAIEPRTGRAAEDEGARFDASAGLLH